MIKNERQYRITKAQANAFAKSLQALQLVGAAEREREPLRFQLQESAVRSQLDDLNAALGEYEALRANPGLIEADFDDLPRSLIRARIAAGLSHQELANRLGMKEQQVQRYEATEYEGVSIDRVRRICRALNLQIRNEFVLPTAPATVGHILKKLQPLGLTKEFVERRLVPRSLLSETTDRVSKFVEVLERVYHWSPDQLSASAPLSLDNAVISSVRYKSPANASPTLRGAYTIYAHYLSLLVLQCAKTTVRRPLPSDPIEIHKMLVERSSDGRGGVSFEGVLDFVWSLGIPILPLRDAGAFHGAWWRINGRDIIVVKQTTSSLARWIVDVLHEYFHALSEPDAADAAVVENTDPAEMNMTSEIEQSATEFAVSVALAERQEDLADACVTAAHGKVQWLRSVVPEVADRESVDVGMLANYLAYRLSFQDINWWPTAQNLQPDGADPWKLAAGYLRNRIDPEMLAPLDRDLLMQALAEG